MSRDALLNRVRRRSGPWDLVVVGGGATGVGTALDAASLQVGALTTNLLARGAPAVGVSVSAGFLFGFMQVLVEQIVDLVIEVKLVFLLADPLVFVVQVFPVSVQAFLFIHVAAALWVALPPPLFGVVVINIFFDLLLKLLELLLQVLVRVVYDVFKFLGRRGGYTDYCIATLAGSWVEPKECACRR